MGQAPIGVSRFWKYARWILELEPLNYRVQYKKGAENLAADRLSRSATEIDHAINNDAEFFEEHIYTVTSEDNASSDPFPYPSLFLSLIEVQKLDRVTSDAMVQLQRDGMVVSGQLKRFPGVKVRDGILYRKNRIIVPASLRQSALELVHRTFHGGIQRTVEEVKKRFYWRGMYSDVEATCRIVLFAWRIKSSTRKQPLNSIKPKWEFPRSMVAFDIATLPWSRDGFRYVLIMVDLFSKYVEAVPMKDQTAQSVTEALESGWFLRHGYPLAVL